LIVESASSFIPPLHPVHSSVGSPYNAHVILSLRYDRIR